jgi:hypothetical protein
MAHTSRTAHKSTGRLPVGQLAPRNVPQPHEPPHDAPHHVSQEEVSFEIELVVPECPAAHGAPTEEQPQQQEDHNNANNEGSDEEYTKVEKMYRDADKVESFGAEDPVPTSRLQALLVHLGITTTLDIGSRKFRVQGGWNSRPSP